MQTASRFWYFAPYMLLFLAACDHQGVVTPAGRTRFDPPAVYFEWYVETMTCANVSGNAAAKFRLIEWYRTSAIYTEGGGVVNAFHELPHTIVIREDIVSFEEWAIRFHHSIVVHEMLHDLIHDSDHSSDAWERCGLAPVER